MMIKAKKALLMLPLVALLTLTILPVTIIKAQDETLFKVTIIAPGNANMVRRQWGQIIANSLIQLGIDARVVYLGWVGVFDRVFTPPQDIVGLTWDEGGYDIQLVGWTPGLIPEPRQLWYGHPDFFAPTGQNYYLWDNDEADLLLDTFITSTDPVVQNQSLWDWQELWFNEMPSSQIHYTATPAVISPELGGPAFNPTVKGDGWLYFNVQLDPQLITGKTEIVYSSTGEIVDLIPPLSNSWYDTIINSCIFNGLVEVATDLSDFSVAALLTDWVPSENGFKWTWTCRSGVQWHDGADFTADDVVFTLWALMNPDTASQFVGYYQSVYGDNVKFTYANGSSTTLGTGTRVGNITASADGTTVTVWLPELALGKPYGYFDPFLLAYAENIIPKHIFEKIDPGDWNDSPFNIGVGEIVVPGTPGTVAPETYDGPVGTGPYKWVEYDAVAQLVHLEKFDQYWDKAALEAAGYFGVTDYYIRFIADKTPALAALKNEEVDILDTQYQMQVDVPTIDPAWGRVLLLEGTGRQEVGYNNRHPVFGTGEDTPLGKSDPARAAEAARYVRTAFDHAIPRQLIIDNLMAGFGSPGATPMLPGQPYYNPTPTSRSYNLTKAAEYLEKAGYGVPTPPPMPALPSFLLGMSTTMSGIYADADGNPLANRELTLWETTDNATYDTTSVLIGRTTTDLSGWYSFTATPPSTGTFYYYLFDRVAPIGTEWTYLTMLNVSSLDDALTPIQDLITDNWQTIQSQNDTLSDLESDIDSLQTSVNMMTYVAVAALVVAIAIGGIAIFMARKRP